MGRIERIGAAIFPVDASSRDETLRAWRAEGGIDMTDDEIRLLVELARATERGGARRVAFELFADLEDGQRVSTADGRRPMEIVVASSVPDSDLPSAVRDQLHGDVNASCWRRLAASLEAAAVTVSTHELRRMPLRIEPFEPPGGP